jgi:hypothetical protein
MVTDFIHFGAECIMPALLRAIIVIAMWFSASYCIKHRPSSLQRLEAAFLIISALFLVYVGRFAIELGDFDYQGGIILVMIYVGTFSRMSARYSITAFLYTLSVF